MPCRSPLQGYRAPDGSIKFGSRSDSLGRFGLVTFRCGVCRDCRLYKAREWAIRAYHEGQLHKECCFVDLTFASEPPTIRKLDLQLFFKRLRKSLPGLKIRYFAVGEYGEKFARPHYHVCIFGWSPRDRYFWDKSPKGTILYRSPHLEKVWTAGHVTVSDLSPEAAGYAARYTLKKVSGEMEQEHYGGRVPEFNLCSLGLGRGWIEKYYQDVARDGFVVFKGKECPVPRYYRNWLQQNQPEAFQKLEQKENERREQTAYESGERLHFAAKARDSRTQSLKRDYEVPRAGSSGDRSKPNRPLDR
jgi:hypothetical protein